MALHTPSSSEKGQSFTELAISLVFILFIMAAVVDLGRAFLTFVALRDAAQEGAAYASFCPADTTNIEARMRNSATGPVNLDDTSNVLFTVTPDCSLSANAASCEPGDGINVTVSSPNFTLSMPFLGGSNIPISANVNDTIITSALTCPP
jgi:hypothetical protein